MPCSSINRALLAKGSGAVSLQDLQDLGLGPKGKVLLTILMRLDRVTPHKAGEVTVYRANP